MSTGLNGPLRDTILRHFDRKTGPEAFFGALSGACSKREMPPVHELHWIKMGPNEPCALFAERLKSFARRYIREEMMDEYCLGCFIKAARHGVRKRLDFVKPKSLAEAVLCAQDVEEECEKRPDVAQRTADYLNNLSTQLKQQSEPQRQAQQQQFSAWQQRTVEHFPQQTSTRGEGDRLNDVEAARRELLRDSWRRKTCYDDQTRMVLHMRSGWPPV